MDGNQYWYSLQPNVTQVLIPTQKPGTPEVDWQTARASTDGDIGARVSRKLASSEELIARLGSDLELSLELRANKPDGYDDATQRIVSENAANLGATASEFE